MLDGAIHLTPFQVASVALPLLIAGKLQIQVEPDIDVCQFISNENTRCVIGAALTREQAIRFNKSTIATMIDEEWVYTDSVEQNAWMVHAQHLHDQGHIIELEMHLISVLP